MITHKPEPTHSKFWTPGVRIMTGIVALGSLFILARFFAGLGYVANFDNQHPWGIWIAIDVATGVVLSAGGFMTALIVYIFDRRYYKTLVRPALLTATLGYTFVAVGVMFDLGRYWAVWHPLIYPQVNSVLFEVGICVMFYLTVLYIEFMPILAEQYRGKVNLPGFLAKFNKPTESILSFVEEKIEKVIWIFIILGVVLSHMHQSSLGTLMLIAPTKMHQLWYSPLMPLMFLISAYAVAFPMVIFETTMATKSLQLHDEMEYLTPLSRIAMVIMGIYIVLKIADMAIRGTYTYLFDGSTESNAFMAELFLGMIIPFIMLIFKQVRNSRKLLTLIAVMIIGGVVLNRINVFLVAYNPPYAQHSYFPSFGEIIITVTFISCIMLLYRIAVTYLPILNAKKEEGK